MILNNAPQAEAILSNVGEIGEFRIRNSAKAFNILSSGLYANKIKAIIRELSCNAIDSHTAAGTTQPFEVHLPTTLEPWFSIRDFGTGLSHDQVTKIYTTYFESTKTESNAFIGALGLGSKSPFSYTDNFTVMAIQDGRKGIYSAFINNEGVPSIALMGEEQVTESNGVEVKFSVNDRYDFNKFADEAQSVYRWFPVLPTITGNKITVNPIVYETKDIIAGVHSLEDSYGRGRNPSVAVMGNIAYPIEVPQAEQVLEGVHQLLKCGLVIEFGIGELDFQASREGLSYIPLTIDSIRKKLVAVNSALTEVLGKEADAISCAWTRSQFLHSKKRQTLWKAAVWEYANNTLFPLYETKNDWNHSFDIKTMVSDLNVMNIQVKSFGSERGVARCRNYEPKYAYDENQKRYEFFEIGVTKESFFVVNDTNKGSFERAKHHFRNKEKKNSYRESVYVLDSIDKTKPMNLVAFYTMMHNPPAEQRLVASTLDQKPRNNIGGNGFGKNVTILQLEKRGGSSRSSSSNDMVWRAAGTLDTFDKTQKMYYVPMSGFVPQFKTLINGSVADTAELLRRTGMPEFAVNLYGVRKGDIESIKKMSNWINIEDHIVAVLNGLNTKIGMALVLERLDKHQIFGYNYQKVVDGIDVKSPAKMFLDSFVGLPKMAGVHWLKLLMQRMNIENKIDVDSVAAQFKNKLMEFSKRYPLIDKFGSYADENDVCEYVNLIDTVKGI
jgi:hypothetical protein